jgi:putative flippase GtrA
LNSSILKFLFQGTVNTTFGYIIFALAIYLGFEPRIALAIDYIFIGFFSFVMNKFWVFSSDGNLEQEFSKFIFTLFFIFLLNLIVLSGLLQFSFFNAYSAQLIAIIIVTISSYLIQKFWVFS